MAISFITSTYIASFVGCYTGVALGRELNIVEWIFAVTAGMFLYIALVELVRITIVTCLHIFASLAVFYDVLRLFEMYNNEIP